MTAFALLAEFALMHVIIIMATDACKGSNDTVTHLFAMAGIAIQLPVGAIKLETGTLIVIEVPCFP